MRYDFFKKKDEENGKDLICCEGKKSNGLNDESIQVRLRGREEGLRGREEAGKAENERSVE